MKTNNFIYYFGLITQVGLTVISSVLVSLLIGIALGRLTGAKAFFLILFLPIGIAGGFYSVYKQILKK